MFVDTFTDGVLGPSQETLGPVEDGGHIVVNTAPGCWGPMITPGCGEATRSRYPWWSPAPSRATRSHPLRDIVVTSIATASGIDR